MHEKMEEILSDAEGKGFEFEHQFLRLFYYIVKEYMKNDLEINKETIAECAESSFGFSVRNEEFLKKAIQKIEQENKEKFQREVEDD